ncbi:MAG: serpin family protein [Alphaproteobacteria bacterium]|nr:serpin family protein [Alphaproteobacteria bacterium]
MKQKNSWEDYQDNRALAQSLNGLTLAFAKAVGAHQEDAGDNLVVSPYNAVAALSMVARGADTETRAEMAQTLFGTTPEALDGEIARFARLNDAVLDANKEQVTLKTANGVWVNNNLVPLKQDYADDLKKTFGAEISGEDFNDATVPAKINKWAAENTNNLITEIVKQLQQDDYAVLASSLYFKGSWARKFDKDKTEDKAFNTDDAGAALHPTMQRVFVKDDNLMYQEGADYKAVSLAYGDSKNPSMRLVLVRPEDEKVSARDWLAQQADGNDPAWLGAHEKAVGSVELPRLDIKQKHDLIPPLKDMGVKAAFDVRAADFSRMADDDLCIGKVTHDVVFKTNEEGSEAAAVTTVMVLRTASFEPPPKQVDMKLDRSFVFALQDNATGAVIFAGAVNRPDGKKPGTGPKPA